ncbi:MAG: hypothetical protein E7273_13410 [Pseudobutyrivibrio ruminis]|nr:hypothetical protein [Pseudobutyrivibrio ruminis]
MKKKKDNLQGESTLLQEIIRTYRYPDGTLNGIAVFISTLALVLLLILGHFMIIGINNIKNMKSVSASELTIGEIEEYITNSYLDAIDEQTPGELNHEAAKRQIINHISEYLNSSEAFTQEQKEEILNSIETYLSEMNFDELTADNTKAIDQINNRFEKYVYENNATLEQLKTTLQSEIDNNNELTNQQLELLKDLNKKLSDLELEHFNQANQYITETVEKLNALTNEVNNKYDNIIYKLYNGIDSWNPNKSYKPNDYVMYNNILYRNITGQNTSTSPDNDKTNWQEASITTVINNNYNTFLSVSGASDWQADRTYNAGEYVIYNNMIYKCVADNMHGTAIGVVPGTDSSVWEPLTLTQIIDNNYNTFITSVGASDYDPSGSYQAGDYVIYNNHLYQNVTGENGLPGESADWEEISITNSINELSKQLDELALKNSASVDALKDNLTDIISKNKSLTDTQREELLEKINENADVSAEGLSKLYDELMTIINSNETSNTNERQKLKEQMEALEGNTSSYMTDFETRIKRLEDKTTATEQPSIESTESGSTEFDFGYQSGVYGYWIGGTFYPF